MWEEQLSSKAEKQMKFSSDRGTAVLEEKGKEKCYERSNNWMNCSASKKLYQCCHENNSKCQAYASPNYPQLDVLNAKIAAETDDEEGGRNTGGHPKSTLIRTATSLS